MSERPRIVLLSNHSFNSQCLTRVFHERGLSLDAVLVQSVNVAPFNGGAAKWVRSVAAVTKRRIQFHLRIKRFYTALSPCVVLTGNMNSASMLQALTRLKPDYILVGGGGILRPETIHTAQHGVLNGHPALLPWMRGCHLTGRSIEQGIPAGATLHYIDAGIDTGAIIERRLLPVTSTDFGVAQLEWSSTVLATQMAADAVDRIQRTGMKPEAIMQSQRYPLYKLLELDEYQRQAELFQPDRAVELFEKWKPVSSGAPDWRLPDDLMDMPD